MIAGETLAGRTERLRRDAAAAAQAEARRQAVLDAASTAARASPPAPLSIPSSAAPAAAQPAPAIVDRDGAYQLKERPMSNDRKRVEIKLSSPVLWFNKSISSVVLREPSAADFFTFGEPRVVVSNASGAAWGDVPDAMKAYLDKYLEVECGWSFLTELGVKDGKAIKDALFSFFREEAKAVPE